MVEMVRTPTSTSHRCLSIIPYHHPLSRRHQHLAINICFTSIAAAHSDHDSDDEYGDSDELIEIEVRSGTTSY